MQFLGERAGHPPRRPTMNRPAQPKRVARRKAAPGNREAIRLGMLNDVVAFNLRLAQDASFRAFARHSGDPHLKPGRFAAMMIIHENPGLTQAELGRAIARDKSSVSPLVQALQRKGLVTRRVSDTDRRRATLNLTEAGEAALKTLLGHALEHDRKLDAIVGAKKKGLIQLLKKIADELS
jgi:DNA-binding MarR family transcriptional regulator